MTGHRTREAAQIVAALTGFLAGAVLYPPAARKAASKHLTGEADLLAAQQNGCRASEELYRAAARFLEQKS